MNLKKQSIFIQIPARHFRIAGLVTEAQHRISKKGNKYGVFYMEDYTSKMELMLWSEDYVRFSNYLEAGNGYLSLRAHFVSGLKPRPLNLR